MITIGLDISTCTGVYVMGTPESDHGLTIEFPNLRGMQRVMAIKGRTLDILERWQPDLVVVENYAHGKNIGSFIKVVEVGTIMRECLYSMHLPWVTIRPTVLKKWVTGSGAGKKKLIKTCTEQLWGFTSPSDDIVDAYCLAKMGQMGIHDLLHIEGVDIGS